MLFWYRKFCCGIYDLLKEKAKSDIPALSTFVFTIFLFLMILFGLDSIIHYFFEKVFLRNKKTIYLLVLFFSIPNYLFVFRKDMFLKYYEFRVSIVKTISIVFSIILFCLILVLLDGPRIK